LLCFPPRARYCPGDVTANLAQNERSALDWLYGTQMFGIKLGLENVTKAMGILSLPKPGQQFFHVAGTNGKGSVCAFLHSLLKAADINAGLFTSPHLVHFRERIRDAEREISSAEIARGLDMLKKVCEGLDPHPTFFELAFLLGLDWFKKRQHDWVVLETGMGGRLDATNAVTPAVSVITSIGLDHQQYLGHTLREIAAEKAGIIKPGVPLVTFSQKPEAMQVIAETARARGAPMTIVTTPLRGYEIGLFGQHQLWNATLAVAAFKAAGFKTTDSILRNGLKHVQWPARFQRFEEERIIVDGAHNPDAAEVLARTWQQAYRGEKAAIVFGGATGKDTRSVLRALQPIADCWHFTSFDSPRAIAPELLLKELNSLYLGNARATCHPCIEAALAAARTQSTRVLVTGSLYLAGEMLALLRGEKEWFQRSAQ
jgi:dihydrofolate synthase/folylpolyglutamate synthase